MTAEKTKWTAERVFDCVPPRGRRFRAVARIGMPPTVPRDGELAAHGRCPFAFEPLVPERGVGGVDRFHALCLALHVVRTALKRFVGQGGRVFDPGSDDPIEIDEASFLAYPDPSWFVRRGSKVPHRNRKRPAKV